MTFGKENNSTSSYQVWIFDAISRKGNVASSNHDSILNLQKMSE